jgi:AhpD family alkylhydroperoxidase
MANASMAMRVKGLAHQMKSVSHTAACVSCARSHSQLSRPTGTAPEQAAAQPQGCQVTFASPSVSSFKTSRDVWLWLWA